MEPGTVAASGPSSEVPVERVDRGSGERSTVTRVELDRPPSFQGDHLITFTPAETLRVSVYDVVDTQWLVQDRAVNLTLEGAPLVSENWIVSPHGGSASNAVQAHDIQANETKSVEVGPFEEIVALDGDRVYWLDGEGILKWTNLADTSERTVGELPGDEVLTVEEGIVVMTAETEETLADVPGPGVFAVAAALAGSGLLVARRILEP